MRLHHLRATAFGPFAGTVAVDFDELSTAGLFLLSGPTGAGKTSVLDAVCFALYGDVPGDRSTAKRLRSDHASPDVAPQVVLEATLADRRFRLTRSPAWERPKRRGSGTTTQQASVVVQELVRGEWTTHTTRLDEAGHLVADLLGMTLTQFTQVAMLPQGRFQAFLRARSEERKQLLQQLFRTRRFADVETWLRDRRVELRRASATHHQQVADVVSRVSETAAEALPEGWDLHDLTAPAEQGALTRWVDGLVEVARFAQEAASNRAAEATEAEQVARSELEEARSLVRRRQRVDAAAAEHADLVGAAEDHDLAVAAVDAAQRAASVLPVQQLAERAERAHRRALAAASESGDLRSLPEGGCPRPEEVRDLLEARRAVLHDTTERLAHARTLLPRRERLREVDERIRGLRHERTSLDARLDEAAGRRADLPVRLAELREDLLTARGAERAVGEVRARLDAHAKVEELTTLRAEAVLLHQRARESALQLRETALDVRAARLDSVAAELAGALAAGACCPVCGSAEHPHKAVRSDGAPDAAAEKAAQKAADDASAEEHARASRLRDLDTRLELARQQAGPDTAVATLEEDLDRLEALVRGLPHLESALTAAEQEHERLGALIADLTARTGEVVGALEQLGHERDQLTELLGRALAQAEDLFGARSGPDLPDGSTSPIGDALDRVDEVVGSLERSRRSCQESVSRLEELHRTIEARTEAEAAVTDACEQAGFSSVQSAVEAALEPAVVQELTASIKHHDRRLAAVTAVLAEPGTDEVRSRALPDVDALAERHRLALQACSDAQSDVSRWVARLARLSDHQRELGQQLEAWGPLRAELDLAGRLAQFAEGKSPDNQLQMALSAYVVAYRLTQVVAAANERLGSMSDQRYSLEHSAQRGAGDRRGGLALLVRDDWSGESRDPATLSGGETFVVSLALALGLADVITQEAGGAVLDTLFVDEGFGSLDADTLDDVMDVLDSLRDGGRVVGVVSHVAEMRDRIPTQLLVTKSRQGSTVAIAAR